MAKVRNYWHEFTKIEPGGGRGGLECIVNQPYTDGGLVDFDLTNGSTTGSFARNAAAITYTIDGVFYSLAASCTTGDMRGFTSMFLTTPYAVIGFLVGLAGITTPIYARSATALTAEDLPAIPDDQVLIGYATVLFTGISTTVAYTWATSLGSYTVTYYDGFARTALFEKKI